MTLAHVVLRTTPANYQDMIDFYVRLLSAKIAHASPVITFLRFDDEHHRIAILQTPEVQPKAQKVTHAGLDHIAFTYPSLTTLAQTYVSLKRPMVTEDGTKSDSVLEPIWCVNHGPTTSLYYRDPDGNKAELQVDNFETSEAADEFMSGEYFETNPIGTDFQPESWAEKILARADEDGNEDLTEGEVKELKKRREIGARKTVPLGF